MPRNNFDQPSLFTVTSAVIPSAEDPSKYLRDRQGNYPSAIHEDGVRTWEETFQLMGRDILGRYVGVDRAESSAETGLVYRAKPVHVTFDPEATYQWR